MVTTIFWGLDLQLPVYTSGGSGPCVFKLYPPNTFINQILYQNFLLVEVLWDIACPHFTEVPFGASILHALSQGSYLKGKECPIEISYETQCFFSSSAAEFTMIPQGKVLLSLAICFSATNTSLSCILTLFLGWNIIRRTFKVCRPAFWLNHRKKLKVTFKSPTLVLDFLKVL